MSKKTQRKLRFETLEHRRVFAFGDIDLSFSDNGEHNVCYPTAVNQPETINQVFEIPGGRIFVATSNAGSGRVLSLFKTDQHGDRDLSFGVDGQVRLVDSVSPLAGIVEIEQLSDGTFVALLASTPTTLNAIVAFDNNGLIRQDFGDDGWLRLPLRNRYPFSKIEADHHGGFLLLTDYLEVTQGLVRYDSQGALDTTFGMGGGITFERIVNPQIHVSESGRITVAGLRFVGPARESPKLIVARWLADGRDDASFGNNGVSLSHDQVVPNYPLLSPDGESVFLIALLSRDPTGVRYRITKFNADTQPDETFGDQGSVEVVLPFYDRGTFASILVDSQNRVYLSLSAGSDLIRPFTLVSARLTPTGELDPTFGVGGVSQQSTSHLANTFVDGLQLDGDGLLWYGAFDNPSGAGTLRDAFAIRISGDGNVDSSWGTDSRLVVDLTTVSQTIEVLQLQSRHDGLIQVVSGWPPRGSVPPPSGKVQTLGSDGEVVDIGPLPRAIYTSHAFAPSADGGWYTAAVVYGQTNRLLVSKYLANGSLDTAFGEQGTLRVVTSLMRSVVMRPLADGSVMVVAEATEDHATSPTSEVSVVVRIDPTGQLDASFGIAGVLKSYDKPGRAVDILDSPVLGTAIVYFDVYQRHVIVQLIDRTGQTIESYGEKGYATLTDVSAYRDAAIDEQGRVLVLSHVAMVGPNLRLRVTQLGSDGQLNTTFGESGTAVLSSTGSVVFETANLAVQHGVIAVAATDGFEAAKIHLYGLDYAGRPLEELGVSGRREYDLASHGEQVHDLAFADDGSLWLAYSDRSQFDLTGRVIRLGGSTAVPIHNWSSQFDVSADGHVTARDALLIINQLNGGASQQGIYPDANADTRVTALDALLVINRLNAASVVGETEPRARSTR